MEVKDGLFPYVVINAHIRKGPSVFYTDTRTTKQLSTLPQPKIQLHFLSLSI